MNLASMLGAVPSTAVALVRSHCYTAVPLRSTRHDITTATYIRTSANQQLCTVVYATVVSAALGGGLAHTQLPACTCLQKGCQPRVTRVTPSASHHTTVSWRPSAAALQGLPRKSSTRLHARPCPPEQTVPKPPVDAGSSFAAHRADRMKTATKTVVPLGGFQPTAGTKSRVPQGTRQPLMQ